MSVPRPEAYGAVGMLVDALRRERGLSRKEFAFAVQLNPEAVGHYEYRRRVLRVSMAIAWAHWLACDAAPLVQAAVQDQTTIAGTTLVVQVMESEV